MYTAKHMKEQPPRRRSRVWTLALAAVACVVAVSAAVLGSWAFLKDTSNSLVNTFAVDDTPIRPEYVLAKGTVFWQKLSSVGGSTMDAVVFGDYDTYKDAVVEDGALNVEQYTNSFIKLYKGTDGTTVYVLSKGKIFANPDSSDLFDGYGSSNIRNIKTIRFENFDTSKVKTMKNMFMQCYGLQELDLSGWDTRNVTNMSYMFEKCNNLTTLDVSNWNTSNVENMSSMFYGCTSLKTIYAASDADWSSCPLSSGMFKDCTSLVGGKGTPYSFAYTASEFARIDRLKGKPGYFTDIKDKPVPLPKAITIDLAKKTAMFDLPYVNPVHSQWNVFLQVVIQDQLVAQTTGQINPSQTVTSLPLQEDSLEILFPGGYTGKIVLSFYDPETGEKQNELTQEISVSITVSQGTPAAAALVPEQTGPAAEPSALDDDIAPLPSASSNAASEQQASIPSAPSEPAPEVNGTTSSSETPSESTDSPASGPAAESTDPDDRQQQAAPPPSKEENSSGPDSGPEPDPTEGGDAA